LPAPDQRIGICRNERDVPPEPTLRLLNPLIDQPDANLSDDRD
jgi:hypothetical protein